MKRGRMGTAHNFNPLPPHGGRPGRNTAARNRLVFQSTPSAWRETNPIPDHLYQHFYFNPLPPHGGRHRAGYRWKVSEFHFNPLPPHGGRLNAPNSFLFVRSFQSTPSAWRETITMPIDFKKFNISIHSLRMEGD